MTSFIDAHHFFTMGSSGNRSSAVAFTHCKTPKRSFVLSSRKIEYSETPVRRKSAESSGQMSSCRRLYSTAIPGKSFMRKATRCIGDLRLVLLIRGLRRQGCQTSDENNCDEDSNNRFEHARCACPRGHWNDVAKSNGGNRSDGEIDCVIP